MDIEFYRTYCISKLCVTEEFPFNESALVFKVVGKMFALTNVDSFESVNLKCDPEYAIDLREKHPAIIPGYHMNKKHWNTVILDGSLSDPFIMKLIDDSYQLVVDKLPKKDSELLKSTN
jgi:predicted DNA-binding protein (MmcQ/YjbR family)